MMRRRRPLMRAAMVGGAGYVAGKHMAANSQREASQDEQLAQLQQQQYAAPPVQAPAPVAAAPAAVSPTDRVAALTELKGLLDAGVLTQEEFAAEKSRILGG
jgi:hypothetical protein